MGPCVEMRISVPTNKFWIRLNPDQIESFKDLIRLLVKLRAFKNVAATKVYNNGLRITEWEIGYPK
jgi:hypothetical protein